MSTAPAAPVPPAKKPSLFGTVALDVVKIAHVAKSFFIKAAAEEPEIQAKVDEYGAEIGDVLGAVGLPQADAVESVIVRVLDGFGKAVADSGPVAGNNALVASYDQKLVADFKAVLPMIERLVNKKTPVKS